MAPALPVGARPPRRRTRTGAGRSTSSTARPARSPPGRSTTSPAPCSRPGRAPRSPGRWRAACPGRSAARRSTATRSGSASAPSSCSGSSTGGGRFSLRNLDLLVLLSFSVSLWFFNHGRCLRRDAARLSGARVADRSLLLDGPARPGAARRARLARVGADRGDGVPARLPDRAQRHRLERDRRRPLRGDRRRPDRPRAEPVRQLPDRGRPAGVRARGRGGRDPRPDPDERPLRGGGRARRHVRPRRLRGVSARRTPSSAGAGSGTRCRPPTRRRSSGTCCARSGSRSWAGGSAASGWGRRLPSPGPPGRSRSTSRARTRTTRSSRPCSSGRSSSPPRRPRAAP